jgi:hypothetical protein
MAAESGHRLGGRQSDCEQQREALRLGRRMEAVKRPRLKISYVH